MVRGICAHVCMYVKLHVQYCCTFVHVPFGTLVQVQQINKLTTNTGTVAHIHETAVLHVHVYRVPK